jgi:hypothetical protein
MVAPWWREAKRAAPPREQQQKSQPPARIQPAMVARSKSMPWPLD